MRLTSFVVPVLAVALSACAGMGPDVAGSRAAGGATEQARLRLTDQCMYEAAKTASSVKDNTGPRCQCYARGALRQMSSSEVASAAAGGSVPFSVRSQEIMSACAAHGNAFAEAAPRRQSSKKKAATASSPAAAPSSDQAPAAAPASTPTGGDAPKSE